MQKATSELNVLQTWIKEEIIPLIVSMLVIESSFRGRWSCAPFITAETTFYASVMKD